LIGNTDNRAVSINGLYHLTICTISSPCTHDSAISTAVGVDSNDGLARWAVRSRQGSDP
jgi:hypothetical protein